jgi:H+-translocating NAD(P) transhydrogenase subunit alpha
MNPNELAEKAREISESASQLAAKLHALSVAAAPVAEAVNPFVFLLAIFLMACFVGYYVVWNVTPALHSPLMAVTNGISSVIIVGAMLAAGLATSWWAMLFGFIAVTLASVNIFGGFLVTQRMLAMFKKKEK